VSCTQAFYSGQNYSKAFVVPLSFLDEILAQFPSTKKDDKSSKSGPSSTWLVH